MVADITPVLPAHRQVIEGYGAGGFRISGQRHEGSVLLFPTRVIPWPVADVAEMTIDSLRPIIDAAGEVGLLLLGGGPTLQPVPAELRAALKSAGVVIEAMDTGGACRTYNVLLGEDRRVAAALVAV